MVAERAVLLDHLTRGRFMLGLGPGCAADRRRSCSASIPTETRPLLEEGVDVIMKLLRSDEPVSSKTKAWNLVDARLHLRPYSEPAVRRRRAGGGLAVGPTPRRPLRHRPALDRGHHSRRASTCSACTGT